jgi:ribose-phosphate pyrophosphokinase
MIISHKQREKPGEVAQITAIGEVEGRNIVLIDDLIDTAGTLTHAAQMLMDKGAASVRAAATHAVLSGPAYDRINNSPLTEVLVTDTIPLKKGEDTSKFTVLSVADIFADTIDRVYSYREISSQFIF